MENLELDSLTKAEFAFLIEGELDITLDDEVLRNATSVGSLLEKIPGVKD
ncbi:phosphopantetheine-binding protein [Vibrio coralliirubri]|nr:phosphopantetheine-binding protein [Vibrio coralliirubri]